jgi:hypothetical protein
MHLPHCVAIFYHLPWFCSFIVSNKKSQRNAEKGWGNRMCKRAFKQGVPPHNIYVYVMTGIGVTIYVQSGQINSY